MHLTHTHTSLTYIPLCYTILLPPNPLFSFTYTASFSYIAAASSTSTFLSSSTYIAFFFCFIFKCIYFSFSIFHFIYNTISSIPETHVTRKKRKTPYSFCNL
ncbi:hypothetical protein BDB00DRAFT_801163 [Zychaea mexicana]|uniref:uncharacterized protein n=1 Tax=Zychaea mexicana TaxID=64656 RepID=UPI0022FE6417|nr:uncharacterized protein BDB00DRAFT_801163 [Zychaea mexicana]KAI9498107.1 hypothetical protein BDB00DRAFT_801163 [Zychaea mexicana]